MNSETVAGIRKQPIARPDVPATLAATGTNAELDLAKHTTIHYSSEDHDHPVEHMIDGHSGRGSSRWVSARCDTTEQVIFEFDAPRHISRIAFEVEEMQAERTQEVIADYSVDGGRTYRQVFVQEYTFSPNGATYQRESLAVELRGVTHLRLTIVPNKGGSGNATLTCLRLFE